MGTQDACPKSASQGLCIACNADFWFGACSDYLGARVSLCTHGAVTYVVYLCTNGVCAGAVVTKSNVRLKQSPLTFYRNRLEDQVWVGMGPLAVWLGLCTKVSLASGALLTNFHGPWIPVLS